MNAHSHSVPVAAEAHRSDALKAAAVALLVGAALVLTAGFSHSSALHNAGHDTRHALSFPCH